MNKFKEGDTVSYEGEEWTIVGTVTGSGDWYLLKDYGLKRHRSGMYYPNYAVPSSELTLVKVAPPAQSTESLVAENVSLAKQVRKLEERIARKKKFFRENETEIMDRLRPEMEKFGVTDELQRRAI